MSIDVSHRITAAEPAPASSATLPGLTSDSLGRIASLEVRLVRGDREIEAAQRVRFRVFVEEMRAQLPPEAMRRRRDADRWDAICDHLVVLDHSIEGDIEDQIVGTGRLLRQDVARRNGGFYTASEFALDALLERHADKSFMELGRSCVLPAYRTKRTVELLWQGNWSYALRHRIHAMFGCGSFPGVSPERHALALSFLHHHASARDGWEAGARPELFRTMDLMPVEAVNTRRALMAMPPLIKGYLRLGAMIGSGAVIDHVFNTTDVLIMLPITSISDRYINYYGADAGRFAS